MKRKQYISPCIECLPLQTSMMLAASGEEIEIPWSGEHSGEAGPGEIDDYSTNDTFGRKDDFNPFDDF